MEHGVGNCLTWGSLIFHQQFPTLMLQHRYASVRNSCTISNPVLHALLLHKTVVSFSSSNLQPRCSSIGTQLVHVARGWKLPERHNRKGLSENKSFQEIKSEIWFFHFRRKNVRKYKLWERTCLRNRCRE